MAVHSMQRSLYIRLGCKNNIIACCSLAKRDVIAKLIGYLSEPPEDEVNFKCANKKHNFASIIVTSMALCIGLACTFTSTSMCKLPSATFYSDDQP